MPLLLLSACVAWACEVYQNLEGDLDDLPDSTVTRNQALTRLDELVREMLGALPAPAQPVRDFDDESYCYFGMDRVSGMVKVDVQYHVTGLSPERHQEYIDQVGQLGKTKGWSVRDNHPQDVSVGFHVDGEYRVWLGVDRAGEIRVSAESPCVWPNGTRA